MPPAAARPTSIKRRGRPMVVVRNYFPEFPSLCISKLLAAISVCETNHLARTERRRPLYEGDIPPLRSSVLFVPLSVRRQHASVLLLVFSSPASLHHHPTSLLQKWQNDTESSPFLSVFVTSNLPEMSSPLILLVALQHCQPSLTSWPNKREMCIFLLQRFPWCSRI